MRPFRFSLNAKSPALKKIAYNNTKHGHFYWNERKYKLISWRQEFLQVHLECEPM